MAVFCLNWPICKVRNICKLSPLIIHFNFYESRLMIQSIRILILAGFFCLSLGQLSSNAQDSAQAMPLLPSRLGPMESLLWSEHGTMRKWFNYPLTYEGREKEMHTRRTLLGLHQIGGFATLAAMAATVFVGQKVYDGDEDLSEIHAALAFTTVGAYFTTASLSIFTPPPMVRRNQWSSISTHKLLATIHFSGIMAMPILGTLVADGNTSLRPYHLALGYATLAALTASMIVITF